MRLILATRVDFRHFGSETPNQGWTWPRPAKKTQGERRWGHQSQQHYFGVCGGLFFGHIPRLFLHLTLIFWIYFTYSMWLKKGIFPRLGHRRTYIFLAYQTTELTNHWLHHQFPNPNPTPPVRVYLYCGMFRYRAWELHGISEAWSFRGIAYGCKLITAPK